MDTLIWASAMGLPCQYTWPAEGRDSPESMRSMVDLPEPDGPSSARISPGHDLQVGGGDDLDAILAGLGVVLLDLFGLNNGFAGRALNLVLNRNFRHAEFSTYVGWATPHLDKFLQCSVAGLQSDKIEICSGEPSRLW